ncbi:hypothetical protein MHYP_G00332210 [Metynnis hypsauchen]
MSCLAQRSSCEHKLANPGAVGGAGRNTGGEKSSAAAAGMSISGAAAAQLLSPPPSELAYTGGAASPSASISLLPSCFFLVADVMPPDFSFLLATGSDIINRILGR